MVSGFSLFSPKRSNIGNFRAAGLRLNGLGHKPANVLVFVGIQIEYNS